jgi:hypothetical protein
MKNIYCRHQLLLFSDNLFYFFSTVRYTFRSGPVPGTEINRRRRKNVATASHDAFLNGGLPVREGQTRSHCVKIVHNFLADMKYYFTFVPASIKAR